MEDERNMILLYLKTGFPLFFLKKEMVTANKYEEIIIDKVAIHVPDSYHYYKPELFTELQRNPTITCLSSDWA